MPDEEFLNIGSPVKEFISSLLEQVDKGITEKGFKFCIEKDANAKIELNAVETKEAGGGIQIHIFSAGGKLSDSNSQKMTVYVKKITDIEKARELAYLEEAKARERNAKSM